MKQVLWDKITDTDFNDVAHDAIVDVLEESFTNDETIINSRIKQLYFELPMPIIYDGFAYGFGDTEVRESLHEYIRENKLTLLEKIK